MVGELIDQRLVGGRQRQLVFRQIDLRAFAQHLADRRVKGISWASWHSIRVIASDFTFSSPSDTLPSPLKPLHILPGNIHLARNSHLLAEAQLQRPVAGVDRLAVDAGQHEAMMLQLFRAGGHLYCYRHSRTTAYLPPVAPPICSFSLQNIHISNKTSQCNGIAAGICGDYLECAPRERSTKGKGIRRWRSGRLRRWRPAAGCPGGLRNADQRLSGEERLVAGEQHVVTGGEAAENVVLDHIVGFVFKEQDRVRSHKHPAPARQFSGASGRRWPPGSRSARRGWC